MAAKASTATRTATAVPVPSVVSGATATLFPEHIGAARRRRHPGTPCAACRGPFVSVVVPTVVLMETTHRHVFFADEPVAEADAVWTCSCGTTATRADAVLGAGDGLDGGLLVLSVPAPDELAAVATDDAALLDDPTSLGEIGPVRRSA